MVEVIGETNPLYVKELTNGGIPWDFIIPTIIAIVTTSIVVYDRVKKAKISAKLLSFAYSPQASFISQNLHGQPISLSGQQYFLKLSFQVTGKNYFFSDVMIDVKYLNDNNIYRAKIFWNKPIT
ncbi:MAG: hypothetical protein IPL24_03765 [Bacteroidetes bacterium]|nr:hypothetical protein [Bacteroidota bacterium]